MQSNPQPIPEAAVQNNAQQLDIGSTESSASSTLVSDTTTTETDRSEVTSDTIVDQEQPTPHEEITAE